jgi:hypothetical protein
MMDRTRGLALLLALQIVLFFLSLPGLGIETRTTSQYAAWAGPIFLGLTLLVFVTGVVGILLVRRRPRWGGMFGLAMGVTAVAIVLFDLSAVAGPPDPPGPLVLSAVVLAVCVGIFYQASRILRSDAAASAPARP